MPFPVPYFIKSKEWNATAAAGCQILRKRWAIILLGIYKSLKIQNFIKKNGERSLGEKGVKGT